MKRGKNEIHPLCLFFCFCNNENLNVHIVTSSFKMRTLLQRMRDWLRITGSTVTPQQIRVILALFVGNVIEATTKRKVFKVMEDICFIEIVLVCNDVFQIVILDAFAAAQFAYPHLAHACFGNFSFDCFIIGLLRQDSRMYVWLYDPNQIILYRVRLLRSEWDNNSFLAKTLNYSIFFKY